MTFMSSHAFWAVWHFVVHPWTRYVAAWAATLFAAGWLHQFAQVTFENSRKGDTGIFRPGRDAGEEANDPKGRSLVWRVLRRGFDDRFYGNDGHASIDFAGQWLMGRMLVRGFGHELYDRNRQFEVALAAFPREQEAPAQSASMGHDAENIVWAW